jgi:hypothetical protein
MAVHLLRRAAAAFQKVLSGLITKEQGQRIQAALDRL